MNSKLVTLVVSLILGLGLGLLLLFFTDANVDNVAGDSTDPVSSEISATPGTFTGRVLSASGASVVGGGDIVAGHSVTAATVYLVPTAAIDISTQMTASAIYAAPYPAEAYDEPLEDSIRLRGTEFPQGTTDAQGNFSIDNIPDGNFFVHVTPALEDSEHLPGGDKSRQAYSARQLSSEAMTIEVSSSPSSTASAVGSSTCLACHDDKSHWQQTGHKIAWTAPGAPGPLQDYSRFPDFFNALDSYIETDDYREGTRLELGDYDSSRGNDKFKLRLAGDSRLPIETVFSDVYLWREASTNGQGKYFISMANRLNPDDPNSPAHLEVKLLYGGAVHDQRYIVSAPASLGDRPGWYTLLRYNLTGSDSRLNRQRRVWHDYKFYLWWNAGADDSYGTADDVIEVPPVNQNTIQTMCASCHFTGWERYEDEATGQLMARAVNDVGGALNIDDDPEMDEINIGCENCHGPGSEHVANAGRSRFIVNPKLLSAERSSVVCGRCHDRRQGFGGSVLGYTQALSVEGELARPGISRHELISKFTDPVKKGPTMRGADLGYNIWPDDIHSSKPHQQYSDFLKSKMYRNDRLLVTCSDCHDLHGGTPNARWLIHDQNDPNSPLCQRCHEVEINDHMQTKLGATMKGHLTRCIDCHMAPTVNTGGIAGAFGRMIQTPPFADAAEESRNVYWEGPMRSHVFDVPLKSNVMVRGVEPGQAMPIPYTNSCGTCHEVDELPFK
ncbi:MAG: hypothetical protein CMQ15_08985 [Gammaproteobacteria bacterium]|nr:hypothetical protein [Gammaproteobacteria bacterium]